MANRLLEWLKEKYNERQYNNLVKLKRGDKIGAEERKKRSARNIIRKKTLFPALVAGAILFVGLSILTGGIGIAALGVIGSKLLFVGLTGAALGRTYAWRQSRTKAERLEYKTAKDKIKQIKKEPLTEEEMKGQSLSSGLEKIHNLRLEKWNGKTQNDLDEKQQLKSDQIREKAQQTLDSSINTQNSDVTKEIQDAVNKGSKSNLKKEINFDSYQFQEAKSSVKDTLAKSQEIVNKYNQSTGKIDFGDDKKQNNQENQVKTQGNNEIKTNSIDKSQLEKLGKDVTSVSSQQNKKIMEGPSKEEKTQIVHQIKIKQVQVR